MPSSSAYSSLSQLLIIGLNYMRDALDVKANLTFLENMMAHDMMWQISKKEIKKRENYA